MYGDNGGRNASRILHLGIQRNDRKAKHCYKHQDIYLRLMQSVSNRQLVFATQRKVLCSLLQVSAKKKLTRRGERIIFTKLSLLKADSHIACRAHAVSLPCRAAKDLECVFPI
jgi:hypothetical protein